MASTTSEAKDIDPENKDIVKAGWRILVLWQTTANVSKAVGGLRGPEKGMNIRALFEVAKMGKKG